MSKENLNNCAAGGNMNEELKKSCYFCNDEVTGDVLCCLHCGKMYHDGCVDAQIIDRNLWICELCTTKMRNKNSTRKEKAAESVKSGKSSTSSSRSRVRRKELMLQQLEEEKQLSMKKIQIEVQAENKRLEEEKLFMKKRFEILQEYEGSERDPDEILEHEKQSNVLKWVNEGTRFQNRISTSCPDIGDIGRKRLPEEKNKLNICAPEFCPQQLRAQLEEHPLLKVPEVDLANNIQPPRLSRDQIAARRETKGLPIFKGDVIEWPIFYSAYVSTTSRCLFDNYENMMRLRESLRGEARESVESLLIHEENVPEIMRNLKMIYGRDDQIIFSLIRKVRLVKNVRMDNLQSLITLHSIVSNLTATIQSLNQVSHLENPCLLQEILEKLPNELKLDWSVHKRQLSAVNLKYFSLWLRDKAEAACDVRSFPGEQPSKNQELKATSYKNKSYLNVHNEEHKTKIVQHNTTKCLVCEGDCRSIKECPRFLACTSKRRYRIARKLKLCFACLQKHNFKKCSSQEKCGVEDCTYRHHKLLHRVKVTNDVQLSHEINEFNEDSESGDLVAATSAEEKSGKVVYRIAPVTLYGKDGSSINTFAFLDDGSALTLVDEDIASKLNIKGELKPLCLRWTGNVTRTEMESELIPLEVSGRDSELKFKLFNVRTVKNLGLPQQSLTPEDLSNHPHLKNLPIDHYNCEQPKILIGLDNTKVGLYRKVRYSKSSGLVATNTMFGWIVHGVSSIVDFNTPNNNNSLNVHQCDCQITELVKSHFAIENLGVVVTPKDEILSSDEEAAMSLLKKYTVKVGDRYETCLLWKDDQVKLPDSYHVAVKRHHCLEKRLAADRELAENLNSQMRSYLVKGYCRLVPEEEKHIRHDRLWYLPVFPVINPNKPGKVRVVWDAAAISNGVSLNSMLYKGPDQLTSLVGVLFRFRENKIAVAADLKEMFHQVKIRKEDRPSQRFLWREASSEKLKVYEMTVMTFGASCSPCAAQFVKNLNANQFINEKSRAVHAILNNHYVDDYLDSIEDIHEAITLSKEVREIHKIGGFTLRNWISNSSQLLEALDENGTSAYSKSMNMCSDVLSDKVLGMWWSTTSDTFQFIVRINEKNKLLLSGEKIPTKREILSTTMKIFDPLGLLGNLIVFLKIILKGIWKKAISWDSEVDEESFEEWKKWLKILPRIKDLRIPRCYFKIQSSVVDMHVFVDAGRDAYAAVIFFRIVTDFGVRCALVASKTRVTPMKLVSIPRLELQAAVLGVRLAAFVQKEHRIIVNSRTFWSDSKTVLSWLQRDQHIFKQFVAFRIGEILDSSKLEEWKYVRSCDNVADQGTKWSRIPEASVDADWFQGPHFLNRPESEWKAQPVKFKDEIEDSEVRDVHLHREEQVQILLVDVTRFSKWTRILRTVAYVVRFAYNLSHKREERRKGILVQEELAKAEVLLYRQVQSDCYSDEIAMMIDDLAIPEQSRRYVSKSSSLHKLCPMLDDEKVLRVKGRNNEMMANPIILPRHHVITRLIVSFYHEKYGHANTETVANEVRQVYHVPRLRVVIASVRLRCPVCILRSATPQKPMMSDLPPCRLSIQTRPFTFIGIDYFGPMKVNRGRVTEKRWGVLITCLTIRAIHIELAESLTADSCILALNRFMARRGIPREIFCDCGTNFRGVETELRDHLENVDQAAMAEKFTTSTTKWNFNPPASPHMGGSWERMVRSVKKAMYEILPKMPKNPSVELLYSIMLEAENMVNSRPLTYVPLETEEAEILTPNHFLVGSSNGSKAIGEFNDSGESLQKNWMILQQQANAFSRRWVREYLPTLTLRPKWFHHRRQLKEGDLVLIIDELSPRSSYHRGRILTTRRGKNNTVRSAVVQTASGVLIRPAVKLAVLNFQSNLISDQVPGGSVSDNPIHPTT